MIVIELESAIIFLENKYVDKIVIENGEIKPFYPADKAQVFQEYVDKVAVSKEQSHWLEWFYKRLGENHEIKEMLNRSLKDRHGFRLDDLRNASMYLEGLTEDNRVMIPKHEIRGIFMRNVGSFRAKNLLEGLTFSEGKDLYKSPLIPLKEGYFLIAKWIFSLGMQFDSWITPMLEENRTWSYSHFIGRAFEEYIKGAIEPAADSIRSNLEITEHKYPEIKPWLDKLN